MCVLFRTSESSHDKVGLDCNVALRLNLKMAKPNINTSSKRCITFNKTIYFAFSAIKGVGTETDNKIITIKTYFVMTTL